jgi:hypothetical protein
MSSSAVDRCAWIAGLALLASCGGTLDRPPARAAVSFSIEAPPAEARTNLQPSQREPGEDTARAGQPTPAERDDAAPTWSQVFDRHFASGTAASCGRSHECHASQMGDAPSAYTWLRQRGYIDGTQSALVRANSCLRWFGGNMPPRGSDDPTAVSDLSAWVAAGASEN